MGIIELPTIPNNCIHNAHMFYIKVKDLEQRTALLEYLKQEGILAVFHYVPLHSAPAGIKFCRLHGDDIFTTKESEKLLRLPMYYGISEREIDQIIQSLNRFFNE
jgi:dTDP-4-amino-4,6-dideoxygalactose transaminase